VELVESHSVLEHGPSELGLVIEVRDLLHLLAVRLGSIELLGDGLGRVLELFEELGGDGEVITSGQLGDFTNVSERSSHDDGLVSVLLVVAAVSLCPEGSLLENLLDRLNSRVGLSSVLLSSGLLVPVEDLILVRALGAFVNDLLDQRRGR
jgi:hypothetical protein